MRKKKVIVIGAGIGGLSSALLLAHKGFDVHVFEKHKKSGGKIRTVNSVAGPIDAGPTVLTLKHFFEEIFDSVGEDIRDHLNLISEPVLARHFWPNGDRLDLYSCFDKNKDAIKQFSGSKSAKEFENFCHLAKNLFDAFESPIIKNAAPSIMSTVFKSFSSTHKIIPALIPGRTFWSLLKAYFSDPRLQQLFGRYATYIGGSPFASPAILALIWHAESLGVWRIEGGIHILAKKLQEIAEARGAKFNFNQEIREICIENNKVSGVLTCDDKKISSELVVFNGDPQSISNGNMGENLLKNKFKKSLSARSLSAYVWTFSSKPNNFDLSHHNVFFNQNYQSEFLDIKKKRIPQSPTLYVCAEDRGNNIEKKVIEKFEIIMNAAPYHGLNLNSEKEYELCYEKTFLTLKKMGLEFESQINQKALTTPKQFSQLFPNSNGSLYGQCPQSIMTTFERPTARTPLQGLFLAGGGVHPGPGIPMALFSGKHVAEEILKNQTLT